MEHKEKHRVYAHTFIPSVERLDDNPSLIQLASKARDSSKLLNCADGSKPSFKHGYSKKITPDNLPSSFSVITSKTEKNSDILAVEANSKVQLKENLSKNGRELSEANVSSAVFRDNSYRENSSPNVHTQDVKHPSFGFPTKRKSAVAKSVSPYSDHRHVTSISACTYMPKSSSPNMDLKSLHPSKAQLKDSVTPADEKKQTKTESETITVSATNDRPHLKDPTSTQSSSFYRSFASQSERPPPMKLERRGNQKLPVGIAVARQRTHTTPNKSSRPSAPNASPDLERRYHEALNKEREVFLRENKEISNFTSRLQTGSSNQALPMLNMPTSAMLQGGWEQERSLMTSLLQWQAQQQSALLSSGLPHTPMWLSGASPYHLPGGQTASSLPSPQSSSPGYPFLGSGLGGLVVMPQILQEAGANSMWSSLAALYGSAARAASQNIPSTYPNLLQHQLGSLQNHELQLLHQQALLPHGAPISMPKGNGSLLDDQHSGAHVRYPPKSHLCDSEKICESPPCRFTASPTVIHREMPSSWTSMERHRHPSATSPQIRSPAFHSKSSPKILPVAHHTKTERYSPNPSTLNSAKSERISRFDPVGFQYERKTVDDHNNLKKPISKSVITSDSSQILDLTLSSPENVVSSHSPVKSEVYDDDVSGKALARSNSHSSVSECDKPLISPNVIDENTERTKKKPLLNINGQHFEVTPKHTDKSVSKERDLAFAHSQTPHDNDPKCIVSSGVELLTKAADIHLKSLTVPRPLPRKRKLTETTSAESPDDSESDAHSGIATSKKLTKLSKGDACEEENGAIDPIDVSALDPDVLDAVRGITLLSQSSCRNQKSNFSSHVNDTEGASQNHEPRESHCESQRSVSDCNDDVQSTVSFSSITDSAVISGDCMSSSELKDIETCEKVPLKRRLKKPLSSKKFSREDENVSGANFKLDDTMEAREVDMKMRLADLQRRYKEKQKELAKIQRKNRREKQESSASYWSTTASSTSHQHSISSSNHFSVSKFKFGEITTPTHHPFQKKIPTPKLPKSTFSEVFSSPKLPQNSTKVTAKSKQNTSVPSVPEQDLGISIFEKFASEAAVLEKANETSSSSKEDNDSEQTSDQQQAPSGSRKRKLEKPKRICLPPGETPTVPLVDPSKKNLSALVNIHEERNASDDKLEKKRSRKMKHATKKIKSDSAEESAVSSWVFKSKSKSEKQIEKARKKSKEEKTKQKPQKPVTPNLTSSNSKTKKSRSVSKDKDKVTSQPPSPKPEIQEIERPGTPQLELREEDLVKGLQVLVPLEDKLLYLCQINPIQPPDIYEVTVEGERHRHRPIVMCLEQILKEAVPDVQPRSAQDLCEGSRVAAYWSHKMHCLYTGTIAFDDSDDEEIEDREEGMIQVEFDDGDSSMIPLEDIRLLPRNYPIMQPDAPFMMHYVNRRRNTSDMSNKETPRTGQHRTKKLSSEKKEKADEKPRKKSTKSRKTNPDLSAYDYPANDDAENHSTPRKRVSSTKNNRKISSQSKDQSHSSSASSADEDSDTVFSDSSDDTYDGDSGLNYTADGKRIPAKFHKNKNDRNPTNELWSWHDKDVQKKTVKGKAKKIYHKTIRRGDEIISCGDSAVFLSEGRMYLPYIGRIESMWESWGDNMVVKVRWFYHPEETKRGRLKSHGKHPLYKSSHIDENDVQTISHKCEVVSFKEYCRRMRNNEQNVFYCAGTYDPATGQVTQEHTDKRKQKS